MSDSPTSPDSGPHRGISIAVSYPILLAVAMALVVLLMGTLATTGMRKSNRTLVDQIVQQATERMRLAVLDTLTEPRRISDFLADRVRSGTIRLETVDDLIGLGELASDYVRGFPSIGAVLFVTPKNDVMWVEQTSDGDMRLTLHDSAQPGRVVEWTLDARGQRLEPAIGSYDYDVTERPWYKTAMTGPPTGGWTPLYVWATTERPPPIGSGLSRRVLAEDGRLLGLIDVGLTTRDLSVQMGRISVAEHGRVMIIDDDDRLVACDDPKVELSQKGQVLAATAISDPLLADIALQLTESLHDNDDGSQDVLRFEDTTGESWEIEGEPLGLATGPDWRLVVAIPDRDLLGGVREVRRNMWIAGVIVLGLCGLAGILVARRIVEPVLSLRRTATAIAAGDLEATFNPKGGREFTELSTALSSMTSGLQDRYEMQNAMEIAMEVQQNLLPSETPSNDRLDIAAANVYSDETGGDYYDFPDQGTLAGTEKGSSLVVIGDVTGHGIGAALIMATARSAIRTRLRHADGLGRLLDDVNAVLVEDVPAGRFMTLLLLLISPDASGFRWASAGHDPPIIYDPIDDSFREPEGGNVPLGIVEGEKFNELEESLPGPGSIILAATDGVWETVDSDGDFFGKHRLRDVIRANREGTADEIAKAVVQAADDFRGHDRPADDVTIVVVKTR